MQSITIQNLIIGNKLSVRFCHRENNEEDFVTYELMGDIERNDVFRWDGTRISEVVPPQNTTYYEGREIFNIDRAGEIYNQLLEKGFKRVDF